MKCGPNSRDTSPSPLWAGGSPPPAAAAAAAPPGGIFGLHKQLSESLQEGQEQFSFPDLPPLATLDDGEPKLMVQSSLVYKPISASPRRKAAAPRGADGQTPKHQSHNQTSPPPPPPPGAGGARRRGACAAGAARRRPGRARARRR